MSRQEEEIDIHCSSCEHFRQKDFLKKIGWGGCPVKGNLVVETDHCCWYKRKLSTEDTKQSKPTLEEIKQLEKELGLEANDRELLTEKHVRAIKFLKERKE